MPEFEVCEGSGKLTEDDRNVIISRIHSLLYWVGEEIPQDFPIGERRINLRDTVFNYISKESPTEEERIDALALADFLAEQAQKMEDNIELGDISRQEACELMNEARALLRAVDALRYSKGSDADIKKLYLMKRVDDIQRWNRFVNKFK